MCGRYVMATEKKAIRLHRIDLFAFVISALLYFVVVENGYEIAMNYVRHIYTHIWKSSQMLFCANMLCTKFTKTHELLRIIMNQTILVPIFEEQYFRFLKQPCTFYSPYTSKTSRNTFTMNAIFAVVSETRNTDYIEQVDQSM